MPRPFRVSSLRTGVTVVIFAPAAALALPYVPTTSTRTWVAPALKSSMTCPFVPIFVVTRLGTTCPAEKLRFEAFGTLAPFG